MENKLALARRILRSYRDTGIRVEPGKYGISREEYDSLRDAVSYLRSKFPNKSESWILRAIVRAFNVKEIGNNRWMVKGMEKLGDVYGYYRVIYYETSKKYHCSCYNTAYGRVRKRRICTHIAAVMLSKYWKNLLTYYMKKGDHE